MRKRPFAKAPAPVSNGMRLGYARVSKGGEQNNALQAKALRAAACRKLFEEAASGGRWDRPELHRMLDQLREGDTVVVWKLDRLSRLLKDVLHIMERIAEAGAGFRSVTENIDTTTPAGRMMMQMVGSFAEFGRAMIRERTSAGLAVARPRVVLEGGARSWTWRSGARSPKVSSRAGSLAPIWLGSMGLASRPCPGSSPSTGWRLSMADASGGEAPELVWASARVLAGARTLSIAQIVAEDEFLRVEKPICCSP